MEMLFAVLGGAVLGLGVRYSLPGRETHGVLLLPGVGALAASILWAGLTWLGWRFDGGWIWTVTLLASAAIAAIVGLLLPRRRRHNDDTMLANLSKA